MNVRGEVASFRVLEMSEYDATLAMRARSYTHLKGK
jgi:hypothetical protein